MISENVIPITSFGHVGIPKDYNVQEWSACTNGIINAVNGTTRAFSTTYLLYDNVNSSIIKSSNISNVTLDISGYWTLTFETEYDRDYIPFVNAYRNGVGVFGSHLNKAAYRSDLLFAGYRGASPSSIDILLSWTAPTTPYPIPAHDTAARWESPSKAQHTVPASIEGIGGEDGGFEYFSVVIF